MHPNVKNWLLGLRDSDNLKLLFEDLENMEKTATQTTLNKARAGEDKVFYQCGVSDGIQKVITFLRQPFNKPETNHDT